jgi:hypothetical protein
MSAQTEWNVDILVSAQIMASFPNLHFSFFIFQFAIVFPAVFLPFPARPFSYSQCLRNRQ